MVTAPDGTKYKLKKSIHGDDWLSVRFPNDFNVTKSSTQTGHHSWKAIVDRRVVLKESFTMSD